MEKELTFLVLSLKELAVNEKAFSSLHNNYQITVDILKTYFPNTENSEENYFICYQIIYLHKLSIIFL